MGRIVIDPDVMLGKAVIAGTRITVESVIERMAAGESIDDLLDAHPRLGRDDILAVLDHAARVLRSDVVYPLTDRAA